MFRAFGEDYHEKKLEETHIFPTIKKAGGPAAAYVDVLIAQHQRGRELTDYILAVVAKGAIATGDAEPLARVLDSVELMYDTTPRARIRLSFRRGRIRSRPINSTKWARHSKKSSASNSARTGLKTPWRKSR